MVKLRKLGKSKTNWLISGVKQSGKSEAHLFFEDVLRSTQFTDLLDETPHFYATLPNDIDSANLRSYIDRTNTLIPFDNVRQIIGTYEICILNCPPYDLELTEVASPPESSEFDVAIRNHQNEALRELKEKYSAFWYTAGQPDTPLVLELSLHFERRTAKYAIDENLVRWLLAIDVIANVDDQTFQEHGIVLAIKTVRGKKRKDSGSCSPDDQKNAPPPQDLRKPPDDQSKDASDGRPNKQR